MRQKEETKCKEEEKEDLKRLQKAKAKEKKHQQEAKREQEMTKMEKAKVAVIEALATPRPKRNICRPRRIAETSDSDSESLQDMSVYSSSEASSTVEE